MDGGTSSTQACKRLEWQSDALIRDVTQSSGVSCGESSSVSVASPASLKSQASPLPVSPVEPHTIVNDHATCPAGNRVQRNSAKTNMEHNERILTTTPLSKYEDTEVVNRFLNACAAPLTIAVQHLHQLV